MDGGQSGRATGGVPAAGTSGGGSAGSGAAGNSGAGGTNAGGSGGAVNSPGCGMTAAMACSTSGSPCTIDVDGTSREFYVVLPASYDESKPYPVVFQFHPLGGNAEQGMNMYRIRENMPDAIYVTPQGLGSTPGWPNTNGEDIAFVKAMMEDIEGKYCIDTARYFSTGFSYGGIMSFTISCQIADLFRAIAPMAGFQFGMEASCKPSRPIAAWITNGDADTVVDPDGAAVLKDILVQTNHCETTSKPVDPSPCVSYDGCDAGYPVVWCLVPGQGHAIPSFSSTAIATFFKQF
jgi:polyhydroxybutyrate depolymerase